MNIMKRKRFILFTIIASAFIIVFLYLTITNVPKFETKVIDLTHSAQGSEPMATSVKQAIEVNGKQYKLFPTFDNLNISFESIKAETKEFVDLMKSNYALPDFTLESCEKYLQSYYEYISNTNSDEVKITEQISTQSAKLEAFISVLNVDKLNTEIINYATNNKKRELSTLLKMLPEK